MPSSIFSTSNLEPQAICTGLWGNRRFLFIASNTTILLFEGSERLLQILDTDQYVVALDFNTRNGSLAASSRDSVKVYNRTESNLENAQPEWSLAFALQFPNHDIRSLSYGQSQEILLGHFGLSLISVDSPDQPIWVTECDSLISKNKIDQRLTHPIRHCTFSPDRCLVASNGYFDRLVKVWRRHVGQGSEDVDFDYTYLTHPGTVTYMRWRSPLDTDTSYNNVFYTNCRDGIVRIWAPLKPLDSHILSLLITIDVSSAFSNINGYPTMVIVDHKDLLLAIQNIAHRGTKDFATPETHMQKLIELAEGEVELCIALSGDKIIVWGIEVEIIPKRANAYYQELSSKVLSRGRAMRIVERSLSGFHQDDKDIPMLTLVLSGLVQNTGEFLHSINLHFDLSFIRQTTSGGYIIADLNIVQLFHSPDQPHSVTVQSRSNSHSNRIRALYRSSNGKILLSLASHKEYIIWKSKASSFKQTARVCSETSVKDAVISKNGHYLITLHAQELVVWKLNDEKVVRWESIDNSTLDDLLCLISFSENLETNQTLHAFGLRKNGSGVCWIINIDNGDIYAKDFQLPGISDIHLVAPVDPMGWKETRASHTLDTFCRDVLVTISQDGQMICWTAAIGNDSSPDFLRTSEIDTLVKQPSLAKGTSHKRTALVDFSATELTIWDNTISQFSEIKEFRMSFSAYGKIRDLDWTCTPDSQSILSIGFQHQIILLCQKRLEYSSISPSWICFRRIDLQKISPIPISDSIWMNPGRLVVGIGSALMVYERRQEAMEVEALVHTSTHQSLSSDIFENAARLNGPVPVYHPQFLQQALLSDKLEVAKRILCRLCRELRFYVDFTDQSVELETFLGIPLFEFLQQADPNAKTANLFDINSESVVAENEPESSVEFDEKVAEELLNQLTKIPLPALSGVQQAALSAIVDCIDNAVRHQRSMDKYGLRYFMFFRQFFLAKDKEMSIRDVMWANLSSSQDMIIDLIHRSFGTPILWKHARGTGMYMWVQSHNILKEQAEIIARNQYTEEEPKDPTRCALFYLALKKKTVLLGLWRLAGWHPEQRAMIRFLSNNFEEQRWKTAAMKNAFVLLGKRRFEYAASFFLLAGSLKDAVNVCIRQLKDYQLAIALARVYDSDESPILRDLIMNHVLPSAVHEGNRWLTVWAFWFLKKRDKAVQATISPLHTLLNIENPSTSLDTLADDPALVVMYRLLRDKSLQTLKGASAVLPKVEFDYVLHMSRLYDRMGCDILGLDLVRNWEFTSKMVINKEIGGTPGQGLTRRGSLIIADLPPEQVWETHNPPAMGSLQKLRPAPVYEEPDMSAFGI
ncbi:Regulator of V-ATPase in vacuolar membrane protein 1 [Neolecta irregularis DAH-3]|uniref:Regulator of V-ATPase in vacuolar membrane protein 1 n=1 Tax=Neolecta irregularis (strain DAH-3) TaxID=1198029 RepID=A0A1U7LSW8_NEOID|nr:Regulator of V-ATPase in vacuolar membrane protein 1 [Neolecta irregularis DAH-3]|eukprot:OLL25757.1 Regulator of V-ATPase in vacuolar membrane protein 1 [Neolecta irregularis DAH-3]